MSKHDEISRRDFASRLGGIAAAAVVVGRDLAAAPLKDVKPLPARVMGANDRVVLASIGVRGQGDSLKRGSTACCPCVRARCIDRSRGCSKAS